MQTHPRSHTRTVRAVMEHALGVALAHANPRALPLTHGAGRHGCLWLELSGEECALDSSDITPALWRRSIGVYRLRVQDCGSQHGDTNHCDASDAEPDDAQPDDAQPDDAQPDDAQPDDALAHVRPRMLTVHALGVALAHASPRALPHTHGAGRHWRFVA